MATLVEWPFSRMGFFLDTYTIYLFHLFISSPFTGGNHDCFTALQNLKLRSAEKLKCIKLLADFQAFWAWKKQDVTWYWMSLGISPFFPLSSPRKKLLSRWVLSRRIEGRAHRGSAGYCDPDFGQRRLLLWVWIPQLPIVLNWKRSFSQKTFHENADFGTLYVNFSAYAVFQQNQPNPMLYL